MMMSAVLCTAPAFVAEASETLEEQVRSQEENLEQDEKDKAEGVWALAYMEKEVDEKPVSVKDKDSWLVFGDESDEFKFVLILSGEEMLKGEWKVYEDVDDAYVLTPEEVNEDAVAGMFCPAGKLYEEDLFVIDISDYFLFFTKAPDKDPEEFLNKPEKDELSTEDMEEIVLSVEEAVEGTYSGV